MSLTDRLSFRQCTMTDQLAGCLVPTGELTGNQRDEMFRLMDRHYVNVLREIFDKDLDEKDQVILMTDPVSQQILGFSTQLLVDFVIDSFIVSFSINFAKIYGKALNDNFILK